jgi:hypothetical protein
MILLYSFSMNDSKWTWEVAYKKWFFVRFFLLLVALGLTILLAFLTFNKQEETVPVAENVSVHIQDKSIKTSSDLYDTKDWEEYKISHPFSFSFKYPEPTDSHEVYIKPVDTLECAPASPGETPDTAIFSGYNIGVSVICVPLTKEEIHRYQKPYFYCDEPKEIVIRGRKSYSQQCDTSVNYINTIVQIPLDLNHYIEIIDSRKVGFSGELDKKFWNTFISTFAF